MFHSIPQNMKVRMDYLSLIDQKDRNDGTPRMSRLRQIPEETGKFISLLFASSPEGKAIEIGTSAGYSTLWLSLAAKMLGRTVMTFELLEEKIVLAKATFKEAEVEDLVQLVEGDALENLKSYNNLSFCFIDCEKEIYSDVYELVVPRMVTGGIIVIDNIISHGDSLKDFIEKVLNDNRVDSVIVPIGKGELVCRII